MRMKYPNRTEVLLVSATALTVASAVFAFRFWSRRGICLDSAICATVAILSLIGIILLVRRMAAVRKLEEMSDRPVFLVMTSGPRKDKERNPAIKGKMPEESNH